MYLKNSVGALILNTFYGSSPLTYDHFTYSIKANTAGKTTDTDHLLSTACHTPYILEQVVMTTSLCITQHGID